MSFTRCIKLNAARAGKISVSGTEILAGVVLNQCFSNVLRVHKTSPRANPGTWSQKWPKGFFSRSPTARIELKISRFRFSRTTQLHQSTLPTWKYVLWVGIYSLEVSSLSKMYCRPDSSVAMTCEHNNHQSTHNPCESPGMPCESFRIGINLKFVKLQCTICCTTCKCRTTRSRSMNCSSLVQIQLLPIKPILFSMEKWIINVEFSAEHYSSACKDLRTKIPPMESVFTEIQIWQSEIARQNILDSRKCLLVLNRSRITKQNSKRICCCWDNRESPKKWTAWQEATCPGNRSLGFTPRKVFGLCRRSRVLSRSGKSKRGSNATSGCRENWELLCLATGWEEASVSTINLSFLSNHWPLSSPVSCFRTDSTCLSALDGRKHSAARIRVRQIWIRIR